jgi:uncharacterized membrane protein required for colicin V production
MADFIVNIVLPFIVAAILISVVFTFVRIILDAFGLTFKLFRIAGFFALYYFVGEYILKLLEENVFTNMNEYVRWLYIPIQTIISFLNL